ncbi:SDR family NAD(P)-dependent oxidoreductase [Halioxenophilus aromaticivorans]|uniref:SDR family NAD(P)-dependent oxidoreductase n=1 Tax=Halioxenophilus aromaticivorans TaxID=1306992 RepID=A0AAV3U7H2_9ALTE
MNSGVVLVTGASKGLGRGIARAFGSKGFTVYITGRSQAELTAAAAEVTELGGRGIAHVCDHENDSAVEQLFTEIRSNSGRLDILVNNAAAVHAQDLSKPGPYWQKPLHLVDMINVGLRSNYVAAYHATPLLIETGGSLMVHISFYGAVSYFHGPAYGAAKAGTDKMNFDMACDLAESDVASVALWPGLILSDELKNLPEEHLTEELKARLMHFESPEFTVILPFLTEAKSRVVLIVPLELWAIGEAICP